MVSQQKIREKQLKFSELDWKNLSCKDLLDPDKGKLLDYDVTDISDYPLDEESYASIHVALFKNIKD